MFRVDIDWDNDILYVKIGDTSYSYGEEKNNEGFVVLRDMNTDEITGITILNFAKKYILVD